MSSPGDLEVAATNDEVIYSDGGLAPSEVAKPPLVVQQSAGDSSAEAVLISEDVPPQLAFEIFQGKVYSTKVPKPKSLEVLSPLERLARLQQEAEALEAELLESTSDSGRAFDEEVVQLATNLKGKLATLSSSKVREQDDLTKMIQQQLQGVRNNTNNNTTDPSPSTENGTTGLVYELYGNATNPTTTLEERLLNLERLVGNQTLSSKASESSAPKSLLNRLEDMEALVATVDAGSLEKTATKAKVIRADLEAASKARNKLTATYKKEDSKMIQELYQQMIDLEGLGAYLPHLVERLQQLSNLHQQAATFGSRLSELEKEATQVEATVGQLEDGMATLQTTMVDNLALMETNMKHLDEKLASL